ncbi:MAG: DUF1302 family protein [Alphaproteobacteria bacterium]|nr:DUF1302 family protein [Alphaproteobacteria bacterium]
MSISRAMRIGLLAGASGACLMLAAGPASAIEFEVGDIKGTIDTTLTAGATMRVEDQSCKYLNGPATLPANTSSASTAFGGGSTGLRGCLNNGFIPSSNRDDANINYDKWDVTNATTKFVTDLSAEWENFGIFVRAKGFYDIASERRFGDGKGDRPLTGTARDAAIDQIDLLDYFVYGNFDVADRPLQVRLGNQVVNWGESLIFQGGINSYLPIDVTALRAPGAELKEALLPQPTIYASYQLTDALSVEAMYIYNYTQTLLDPCGTFFAITSDAVANQGCRGFTVNSTTGVPLVRDIGDTSPDQQGQFGVALRYYAEDILDGTEFGLYFINQHLKLPMVGFTTGNAAATGLALTGSAANDTIPELCAALGNATFASCLTSIFAGSTTDFQAIFGTFAGTINTFSEHNEDIASVGASWSTTLFGTAFSGEVAYYPDAPFQLSTAEITAANIDRLNGGAFICDQNSDTLPDQPGCTLDVSIADFDNFDNGRIKGYKEHQAFHAQFSTVNLIQEVSDVIGSNTFALITNFGLQWLPDVGQEDRLGSRTDYDAAHVFTSAILSAAQTTCVTSLATAGLVPCATLPDYADNFSWGYRVIMNATYPNSFGSGVTLTPSIQWRHDVEGDSAGPIGPGFVDNLQAINIGLSGEYLSQLRGSISYNTVFGNSFTAFEEDKDYVTFEMSYSF